MSTPPPPLLRTGRKAPAKTTCKTLPSFPGGISAPSRVAKSEQQPNRMSSRFNGRPAPQRPPTEAVERLHQSGLINLLKTVRLNRTKMMSHSEEEDEETDKQHRQLGYQPQRQQHPIQNIPAQMPQSRGGVPAQVQPMTQTQPRFQPQVQPRFQPQVQPHVQSHVKPQVQPQVQQQIQPHVQPQVQPQIQPQVQPHIQSQVKPQEKFPPPQTPGHSQFSLLQRSQSQVTPLVPPQPQTQARTQSQANIMQRSQSQLLPGQPDLKPQPTLSYKIQVNRKTYRVLKKIGCGGSSKVYEGFDPENNQTVALKIINMASADPKSRDSYLNERLLLYKLRKSKRVVRMYDSEYREASQELILVMEKGDADLAQVIESYFEDQGENRILDYEFVKFHWKNMLLAVHDIHLQGVVHADLKPVNFIVVKSKLKLIDFGIANTIDPDNTSVIRDYQVGTINYMAPEALKNRASENQLLTGQRTLIKYNSKADIWSLGCILYNMVYGRPPFHQYPTLIAKAQAIIDPRHKIEYPPIKDRDLLECMQLCLRHEPADRPSAEQLLKHPYLSTNASNDHTNNNNLQMPQTPLKQHLIEQIIRLTPRRTAMVDEILRQHRNGNNKDRQLIDLI